MNSHQAIAKLRSVVRRKHFALSTEESYAGWLGRFMRYLADGHQNPLAIPTAIAILWALALGSQPALPPAINRSGVAQTFERSAIANPSDVGARQGPNLCGSLLCLGAQKGTIMPQKLKKYPPLKRVFIETVTYYRRKQSRCVTVELSVGAKFMDALNHHGDLTGEPPQWIITRALAREINGGFCQ